jgi:ATP-dependent helicase HepA
VARGATSDFDDGGKMTENQFNNPFVTVISSGDIGKIVQKADENNSIVEFHDSPTDRFQLVIPNSDLKKHRPELNGLVWFPKAIEEESNGEDLVTYLRGTWLLERENGQWGITVRTSRVKGGEDVLISPSQVLIHRRASLFKPVEALSERLTVSSKYFVTRNNLLRQLYKQIQAARGFRSILSSIIRPFQHQINAMIRVLSDPIPRFILADEVGLGKTIETGLIIRQMFLEDPLKKIKVVVPQYLVGQWKDELIEKFVLGDNLKNGTLTVSAFSNNETFSDCDLLVVDESHKITESQFDEFYSNILSTLHAGSGLLLLTATPMRGNLQDYLKLLHLVDPESYPIEEESQFKKRLELREESSRLIDYIKVSGIPEESLINSFQKIRDLFPLDSHSSAMIEQIEELLKDDGDCSSQLNLLSSYLRERFRISRRVIRNRRTEVIADGFLVTGREITSGNAVTLNENLRATIDTFISQFLLEIARIKTGGFKSDIEIFELTEFVLESALSAPEVLHDALKDDRFDAFIHLFSERLKEVIEEFNSDFDRLGHSERWTKTFEICDKHVTYPHSGGVVVFVGNSKVARNMADELSLKHGKHHVRLHIGSQSTEEQDAAVDYFIQEDGCRILVMDASGDEGRNLQSASEIVHFSLPVSANRLEQRLGRADRFSELRDHRATSTVFSEPESALISGQFRYLNEALNIFNRSVATAQHFLSIEFQNLLLALLQNGLDAFVMNLEEISVRLEEEIENIAYIDRIDSVSNSQEFTKDDFLFLMDLDESSEIEDAAYGLYVFDNGRTPPTADLGLLVAPSKHQKQDLTQTMRLSLGIDQRRPAELRNLSTIQKSEIKRFVNRDIEYAFSRPVARALPGVSLFRIGDPLVDWTIDWVENDELGRTWAVWRHDSRKPALELLSGAIRIGARLNSVEGMSDWGKIALNRRLEIAIPSRMMYLIDVLSVVKDKEGREVTTNILNHEDKDVRLKFPAPSLTEQNISESQWLRVQKILPDYSQKVIESSKKMLEHAVNEVKRTKDYENRRTQEIAIHEYVSSIFRNDLSRKNSKTSDISSSQLDEENMIHRQVMDALENPPCEVYSMGLIVMSRNSL